METAALVAPVTALEFLQDEYLLTGEGPVLTVYSLQQHPKVSARLSVLQHYRIHGIRPRHPTAVSAQSSASGTSVKKDDNNDEPSSTCGPIFFDLAVFGGKAVRLVRLHVDFQAQEHLHLEVLGPLMELQDWALDVCWLPGETRLQLGVAVAHNSALLLDITTEKVLAQRSCSEGCLLYSALLLVHESWADTVLVGGTVFNQLVLWKPGEGGENSDHKAPVERRLLGHSGVIFSITYLQEKGWLASASDDRSVRVWGVGALGGPGGKCGDLNPTCLRVLYGHQARVFSVHLSPGKVFSAGEDGACLVWDWAEGGKVERTLKGHRAGGVRALAVSEGTGDEKRWVATGGADGGVRLWRVEVNEEKETLEEAATEKLTTLKFPGEGLPKVVCIAGREDEHAGWTQSQFVVCTDQGLIYQYSDGQWETLWQGGPEFQSYCVMETTTVSVKDSTAEVSLCAVGNLSGSVQVFPISQPQSGILLTCGSGKIHSLIFQEVRGSVCLLASGPEGLVHRWCIKVDVTGSRSMAIRVNSLPPFLLPPCAKRWLTAAVLLHSTSQGLLWVCGDRRGSLLLFREEGRVEFGDDRNEYESLLTDKKRTVLEGDEAEGKESAEFGVMIEGEQKIKEVKEQTLHSLSCLFGAHGKQGVTSVCEHQGLLYSTGRDGCVRVFKVVPTPTPTPSGKPEKNDHEKNVKERGSLQLEVLRVQRACKGMEWLERVLFLDKEKEEEENINRKDSQNVRENLEGERMENKEREARFVILGFYAVHFVVWDPVKQEKLLAVPCGGGHRSWALWPSNKGLWPGCGALVFIKQGAVLASQPPGEELSWVGKAERTGGRGLREGIHGRGIGCVCRLGKIRATRNQIQSKSSGNMTKIEKMCEIKEGYWEIVVTGGEDTSLDVLAINPDSGNAQVLSVITDHISSIRTLTAITRPERGSENRCLDVLLVSAGGRAQMQCYRLLITWDAEGQVPSCQVIQVAGHRLDDQWERRRNRHKTVKMDPETRYMCMTVVDEMLDRVLLAVACSDGALRLFSVSEVKRQIHLLLETFHHQRCVLSVASCTLEDRKGNRYNLLLSAATDGKIAVWDLTEASSLSTATSSSSPTPPIPCLLIPAHQSGINSLAVWKENLGQEEDCCLVTVASGGDDGQLTVSTLRVQYPEEGKTGGSRGFSQTSEHLAPQQTHSSNTNQIHLDLHSQSNIQLAHAAPLTDLKFLSPGILVTTSSDQRVCLWKLSSTGINHTGAVYSHVADAAGLAVWEGEMREQQEEDNKRETGFESELVTDKVRQEGVPRDLEMRCETGERLSEDKEKADEAKRGEHVGAESESGDHICTFGETQREEEGWVLVCGQGLQLFRVRNPEMTEEKWMTRGGRGKPKDDHRLKVTLQEKST